MIDRDNSVGGRLRSGGILSRLKRFLWASLQPSYKRRRALTVEIGRKAPDSDYYWATLYVDSLVGSGDDTTRFKRQQVASTLVHEDDVRDETAKVEIVRDGVTGGEVA